MQTCVCARVAYVCLSVFGSTCLSLNEYLRLTKGINLIVANMECKGKTNCQATLVSDRQRSKGK